MKTFNINVSTPSKCAYTGEIEYLRVNTSDGSIGLMSGALPRVCVVCAGALEIKTAVLDLKAVCGDGIMIAEGDKVTLLVESCVFDNETSDELKLEQNGDTYKLAKAQIASALGRAGKHGGDNM